LQRPDDTATMGDVYEDIRQMTQDWRPTALIVVLCLQVAFALFVGLASILDLTSFAHTAADGRRLGVGFWAFAVMLLVAVIPGIRTNRSLFAVPFAWTGFHLADSLFELSIEGDFEFLPPVIVEACFLALYVWLFVSMSPRPMLDVRL
jgi:hypothetical protein